MSKSFKHPEISRRRMLAGSLLTSTTLLPSQTASTEPAIKTDEARNCVTITCEPGANELVKYRDGETLSTAIKGVDYYAPGAANIVVGDGGTGASTPAGARNNFGLTEFSSVAALIADTDLNYTSGQYKVNVGDYITERSFGFRYRVVGSEATDHHLSTKGGVRLKVIATNGDFNIIAFGAPIDRNSDASVAIDAALAAAQETGGTLVLPSLINDAYAASFKTQKSHSVPVGVSVRMIGVLESSCATVAMIIGSSNTYNHRVELEIALKRSSQSDWSDDSSVGVRIIRTSKSRIYLKYINGFTINSEFMGDRGGMVHNAIFLQELLNARIQIRCVSQNSGWFNRNTFVSGGRLGCDSNVNTSINRYGIVLESPDRSFTMNTNIIGLFDFEPGRGSFEEALAFVLKSGLRNKITFSDDVSKKYSGRILGNSSGNIIEVAYNGNQTVPVQDVSLRCDNIVHYGAKRVATSNRGSWTSGFLPDQVVGYEGPGSVNVKRHAGIRRNLTFFVSGATVTSGFLQLGQDGIARRLHGVSGRKYVLRRSVIPGFSGRVAFKCYNSAGRLLTGVINRRISNMSYSLDDVVKFTLQPYNRGGVGFKCIQGGTSANFEPRGDYSIGDVVADGSVAWIVFREPIVAQSGVNPVYGSHFDGSFRTGSDYGGDIFLLFRTDVDYADIIISGGSTFCRIKGYEIAGLDEGTVVTSHPLKLSDDMLFSTQSPQEVGLLGYDSLAIGTIVWNISPSSNSPVGWVKVSAGDPGVFLPLPELR